MNKLTIGVASRKSFFDLLRNDARKLDRGETLPAEKSIHFEEPEDLFTLLTPARVRLLRAVREKPAHISALALHLKRPTSAVRRDVAALEGAKLLARKSVINPGHGRSSVVAVTATRLNLVAHI